MANKPDLSKYGPKVNAEGKIMVFVSGKVKVSSNDPNVVIVRKD